MDLSRPAASLVPTLDAEVLTVLAGTTRPLTGREVGRLVARGSQAGVQKVLNRLAEHGLVDVKEAGPALLHTVNRDHILAPLVESLAHLRVELFERIRARVAAWQILPESAAVFGSAARADGDTDSDIDIFLIRPDSIDADDAVWRNQVSELSAEITRWTGNRASMIEASVAEARAMFERNEPVAEELVRDAVHLAGRRITDVVAGEAW